MAKRRRPLKAGKKPATAWGSWLPYLVLAVAFVAVFSLENFNVGFGRDHHGFLSSHGAALAKNLSFQNRLLLFHAANITAEGKVSYEAYNRFPLFPFAVVKASMMPFEPDLSRQIYAARQTMNLFLALAILFAFLAVRSWIGEPYLALAAVFLAFSSFYVLYYSDMIFNDVPALFGFTLAAWAAIASRTAGLGARSAVFAAVVSVSMGWQPYAVLGAWFLTDLVLFLKNREGTPSQYLRRPAFLALGAAILWGIVVLGLQLANEASLTGAGLAQTNSLDAMRLRLGIAQTDAYSEHAKMLAWPEFLARQADRIVLVFAPLGATRYALASAWSARVSQALIVLLLAAAVLRIVTSRAVAWKPFTAVLIASGFIWAIPMKHFVAFHDFQTIFYLGLPMVAFTGLLLYLPRKITIVPALVALAFFAVNVSNINRLKIRLTANLNPVTYDFANIYLKLPPRSAVFVDGDKHAMGIGHHALNFYLAGHYFAPLDRARYIVSTNRSFTGDRLTSNAYVNLFEKR